MPRVIGRTEAAKAAKSGGRRATRQWDEQSLLAKIQRQAGATTRFLAFAQALEAYDLRRHRKERKLRLVLEGRLPTCRSDCGSTFR